MTTDERIAERWQRRYGERRYIMGVPVPRERLGTMVDSFVVFDIATRHVLHALRPDAYRILRIVGRLLR